MTQYIPEFRDEDFFKSLAFNNKVILQYTIDVMKELSTRKENLVVSHDGHELYLFETKDWHIMFHQHNNNGKVYFDKNSDFNKEPFHYEILGLKTAQKNNQKVEEFYSSYAMSFGSVNYDVNKSYISKNQIDMLLFSAKHVDKNAKEVKRLEKIYQEVDNYSYEMVPPQWILESMDSFNELKLNTPTPSLDIITHIGLQYAQCFDSDYQNNMTSNLNKTKKLCINHNINENNEAFFYHDNSVYYHTEKKALIFTDQNGGFIAFETAKNSWDILYFSSMYGKVEDYDYFFNNKPQLQDITLQIKDGQFSNAGANMYSLHYNVLYAPDAIKQQLGTSKKKLKM